MSEQTPTTDVPEMVERPRSEELDKILGHSFRVLDDGFVRAVDYMGTDTSIVQAARVSYGKGTKTVHEDRGLIRFLMRHRHTTPLEMCELKLHVRVPMDCWRQWIRHRTANVNEYSTRYSVAHESMQKTASSGWRVQASGNRQGSGGNLDESVGWKLTEKEDALQCEAWKIYEERIDAGVAREQARKDLPLSTYTEAYWKIDLHNLLHFLSLRMHSHPQQEIRDYANIIGNEIVKRWCPIAWEAFEDYRLNALILTRTEKVMLAALVRGDMPAVLEEAKKSEMLDAEGKPREKSRERIEVEEKFQALGLTLPWSSPAAS